VEHPGHAICYDTPYFVAIGGGEAIARTQFMVAGFDKTWDVARALWLTFTAKARVEVAGGVGKQTDLVAISRFPPHIHPISDAERKLFYRLFRSQLRQEEVAFQRPVKEIAKRIFASPSAEPAATSQTATDERTPAPKPESSDGQLSG
jgi:hypothetical protein